MALSLVDCLCSFSGLLLSLLALLPPTCSLTPFHPIRHLSAFKSHVFIISPPILPQDLYHPLWILPKVQILLLCTVIYKRKA